MFKRQPSDDYHVTDLDKYQTVAEVDNHLSAQGQMDDRKQQWHTDQAYTGQYSDGLELVKAIKLQKSGADEDSVPTGFDSEVTPGHPDPSRTGGPKAQIALLHESVTSGSNPEETLRAKEKQLRELLVFKPSLCSPDNFPDKIDDIEVDCKPLLNLQELQSEEEGIHDYSSKIRWLMEEQGLTKQEGGILPQGQGTKGPDGELSAEGQRELPRPKKIRHKKRVNGNKTCLVCGDKALAHNFDVITCESCKAFFRRNALKREGLHRCMFQNKCNIDKNTRRFCPSCRLKKCFDIGMKPELILDDEERRLRQEKKAQRINRQAACSSTSFDDVSEAQVSSGTCNKTSTVNETAFSPNSASSGASGSSQPAGSIQNSPLPSIHTLRESVGQSPPLSNQLAPFAQSSGFMHSSNFPSASPPQQSTFKSLISQLSAPQLSALTSNQSLISSCVGQLMAHSTVTFSSKNGPASQDRMGKKELPQQKQEYEQQPPSPCPFPLPGPAARLFQHVPRDQLPSDPFMYWIVSAEERLLLANLTTAYQDVLLSLPERGVCRNVPIANSYFLHDFLNEIDDAMYKIVQFSKHIPDFRLVGKDDQIAMLKASAMQTLGMACCAVYVHERDCWLSLRGDLTLSHLRKLTNDDPYIQTGVEYCRSVKSLAKNDFTIYSLIHCMILFDPRDAKIVDRQLVNQTRDKYVIMLKHYLESLYSYLFADEYFVAIQERVREMCHLAQSGNAFYKRYSSAFQPLIAEMLSST